MTYEMLAEIIVGIDPGNTKSGFVSCNLTKDGDATLIDVILYGQVENEQLAEHLRHDSPHDIGVIEIPVSRMPNLDLAFTTLWAGRFLEITEAQNMMFVNTCRKMLTDGKANVNDKTVSEALAMRNVGKNRMARAGTHVRDALALVVVTAEQMYGPCKIRSDHAEKIEDSSGSSPERGSGRR